MTITKVNELALMAHRLEPLGDEYANQRCRWAHDPQHAKEPMWWGKDQPYYRFLYYLAEFYAGGVAIEVGTHAGIGFACLAAGANASGNPKSWTIGIDKDSHAGAAEVQTKYRNCVFINGLSIKVVDRVNEICVNNDVKIKIMFIDATHTLTWVNAEIKAYQHLFADQVVIVMDDCFKADNNTKLPECFEALPGAKQLYPGLHTDNCIGVAIINKSEFDTWMPTISESELTL